MEASRCSRGDAAAPPAPLVDGDGTAASWDAFHRQHAGVAFFKQRRYIVAEIPQLAARGTELTVLELGCGNGSTCLPVLRANPEARVVACDFAASAVEAARQAVALAGAFGRRRRRSVQVLKQRLRRLVWPLRGLQSRPERTVA